MTVRTTALHFANKLKIASIRWFAHDKEATLNEWSLRIRRRWPTVTGRTYFGATFECDLRDHIMSRIFFFGVWEPSVSKVISNILRPGDVFVDVGANIGYDSLLASKRVGKRGRVVAIEAASAICTQLASNIAHNNARNVRVVNVAVSDEAGEVTLYGGDACNQGRTSPLAREGLVPIETVPMLPLEEILTADERRSVRLIKIDIEGGELPVLERLTKTLQLYNDELHILVEVSEDSTGRAEQLFRALVAKRFTAFSIINDYTVKSYLQSTKPVAPKSIRRLPKHQTDVLFVPVCG